MLLLPPVEATTGQMLSHSHLEKITLPRPTAGAAITVAVALASTLLRTERVLRVVIAVVEEVPTSVVDLAMGNGAMENTFLALPTLD